LGISPERPKNWVEFSLDLVIMRAVLISTCLLIASVVLPSTSRAAPFEKLPGDRIRHTTSGFVFPNHIGPFERAQTQQYNQAGSDVSAAYNAGVLIAATVYVYPAPRQEGADVLAREYASKRAEVLHGHQGVTVLPERPVSVSQSGKKYSGKRAYFSYRDVFAGTPQNVKSQLLVFRDGPAFIEYRFTYPIAHADKAEEEIQHFITGWSWR
jgi:hypothetical protein